MRNFENVAKLFKSKRLEHPKKYSQAELSALLGYKNGQFISNVERGLCSIPLKMLARVASILDIPWEEMRKSLLEDYAVTVDAHFKAGGTGPGNSTKDKNFGSSISSEVKVEFN
ncbi:MAG: helix-turn-helix transcriptional regulator [Halobacteriovoraceae bacterium]|jgi:transcriptional regulator with XRE-family HTH domain|nr:helix-turn-helix transcriptional regulator [Halobacteriovoraceae bacterium]MBT5093552.1 helix-turn-helix transcriptional regulator [Halobacteriovoraceae bacterium]